MCRDYGVPFLGALPLDIRIREQADSGRPTVVADPDGKVAQIYRDDRAQTAVAVAQKAADFCGEVPEHRRDPRARIGRAGEHQVRPLDPPDGRRRER